MPLRNDSLNWGAVAKAFHWLLAVLIFAQLGLRVWAVAWPLTPTKLYLFFWHKSIGMIILLLVIMRLLWLLINPHPLFPASLSRWERNAAGIVHGLIYAVLILLPISGWMLNSATGVPFKVFDWIQLPALFEPSRKLIGITIDLHILLSWALIILLGAHILAVLRHHWIKKDITLKRMLPFIRIRQTDI